MKNKLCLVILFLLPLTAFGQEGAWIWVNGNNTANPSGHFGSQGVPDSANTPPGFYEPCEWTDLQGNFWLFGGVDSTTHVWGDLWKYDVITNNWTWVKGSGKVWDTGSYGKLGIPDINNRPSSRGYGVASWVDLNGDLWLYGGIEAGSISNDLWKYNIASDTWTWMNGSSVYGSPPTYGIQGIPSPVNTPSTRYECAATWVDANNNLWFFGGFDGNNNYNDLWRYSVTTNEWTWMSGADTVNQSGIYGTEGIAGISNIPGARWSYCSWKTEDNKFWLMGGAPEAQPFPSVDFNDMWMYDPSSNEWAWMSGSNKPNSTGIYGALCSSSLDFSPASRFENRACWTDDCGNFWMYGGTQNDYGDSTYSDLWFFNPSTLKWTFVNGSFALNIPPVYNTKSVASSSNQPGARFGSVAWKSNTGDLYLFGGNVGDYYPNVYNDLWKYTIDTSCGESVNCGYPSGDGIVEVTSNNSITIYPNPTTETVNITLTQPCNNCLLTLTDITGRQVMQRPLNGKQTTIDMSDYASGLYLIRVATTNEIKTVKVVKQ